MKYRGINYSLKAAERTVWKYRFDVGRAVKSGRMRTEFRMAAIERVRRRIDRELRLVGLENGEHQRSG
jgi:hypothetical protein